MSKLCFVNYTMTQFERTFQFASEVAQAVDYAYNLFDICHTLMNNIYGRLPVPTTRRHRNPVLMDKVTEKKVSSLYPL